MTTDGDASLTRAVETNRSDGVIEMHLFDDNACEEALCGAETSHNVRSVRYYLEDRVHGPSVGSVCQECKVLAVPLAAEIIEAAVEEQEAEGRSDVAEEYRRLAETLRKETGVVWHDDEPGS